MLLALLLVIFTSLASLVMSIITLHHAQKGLSLGLRTCPNNRSTKHGDTDKAPDL